MIGLTFLFGALLGVTLAGLSYRGVKVAQRQLIEELQVTIQHLADECDRLTDKCVTLKHQRDRMAEQRKSYRDAKLS